MYGLVNKAVEGMVCTAHGEATWLRIKAAAGVNVEGFVSNQPYPDDMTYRLVAAASEVLDHVLWTYGPFPGWREPRHDGGAELEPQQLDERCHDAPRTGGLCRALLFWNGQRLDLAATLLAPLMEAPSL